MTKMKTRIQVFNGFSQSSPGNVNGAFGTTPTGGLSVSGSESHEIQDWQTVFN